MKQQTKTTIKLLAFLAVAALIMILIAKCNEGFNSFTPGKSPYYGKPQIESHGDSAYVKDDSLSIKP